MDLKREMMIDIDGMECCILDVQDIDGRKYIYVSEIVDEDITGNFYVYEVVNKEFEKITNSDDLKRILPIFIQSMSEVK